MDAGVKARWSLLSVILILFSSFEDPEAGGIPSFCNIPPVKEGGNATVTCTFTEDIFVTKSDFEIDRYSSTNKQETLLVCSWIIHKPTCNLNSRIMFDHVITNTFQIQIPNVTSADAGKYICYVLPAPNGISKSCNLTLEETTFISETHAPGYQLPRSSDLPMIDIWTTIQDSKEDGIMSASVMGILIAVIIALIVLQGIICMAGFIYFKRRLSVGTNDNDKEANKGQTKDIKKKTHEKKYETDFMEILPLSMRTLNDDFSNSSRNGPRMYETDFMEILPLSMRTLNDDFSNSSDLIRNMCIHTHVGKLQHKETDAMGMCENMQGAPLMVCGKCEGDTPATLAETVIGGVCHQEVTRDSVMAWQIVVSDCQTVADPEGGPIDRRFS